MKIGLLGEKLSHSLSPKIHNYIYNYLNKNINYELFEISQEKIKDFQQFMLNEHIDAVNITIPYKKNFLNTLHQISENAKKIGAINLMYIKDGKFYGENTDYYGFKYTLEKNKINVEDKKIFILGKGGASLSVQAVLKDLGATDINLVFRENKQSPITFNNIYGDIIINTTPVGMYPNINENLVPENILSNFNIAIDLIYNPLETKFLKQASLLGLKTINGLDMLIEQAIKTDEILFNRTFDIHLRDELQVLLTNHFLGVKK